MSGPRPSLIRRILGDILIAVIVFFTVLMSFTMAGRISSVTLKDNYIMIFLAELAVCTLLLTLAVDIRFGILSRGRSKLTSVLGKIFRVLLAFIFITVLVFGIKISITGTIQNPEACKYAIVLGHALINGEPSEDLISRVNKACDYYKLNQDTTFILTGGNSDASGKTEAGVMQELLTARGIPESKMILEDKSRNTRENFANIAGFTDPSKPVVLITSDYHMDRAAGIAKRAGLQAIRKYPAPSAIKDFPANIMWEIVSEIADIPGQPLVINRK